MTYVTHAMYLRMTLVFVSYEPRHEISNIVICAIGKASDQPAPMLHLSKCHIVGNHMPRLKASVNCHFNSSCNNSEFILRFSVMSSSCKNQPEFLIASLTYIFAQRFHRFARDVFLRTKIKHSRNFLNLQ